MTTTKPDAAKDHIIVHRDVDAPVLVCTEGVSFWGGVDAQTGKLIDAHHPQYGAELAGKIVLMPTSRGSCSGSGVLMELAMNGHAPAALVFQGPESVLTLGAFLAARMYGRPVAVLHLSRRSYKLLAKATRASLAGGQLWTDGTVMPLSDLDLSSVKLTEADNAQLGGTQGPAAQLAMETIRAMAVVQGADRLIDISRGHIDGCIYASPANLTFAETMQKMGARVAVPTSMNAISVDFDRWRVQGVPGAFGSPASQLASAYVAMGAKPNFTCAPYLDDPAPEAGENIGWSESNAVIYANSILGARTAKHPDFFDLFVALTGRAPRSDVYLSENRQAQLRIDVTLPEAYDDAIWPMLGWIAGQLAPDQIPLLAGLESTAPSEDDLKALCAAFGTTSGAPLLHIKGITPESNAQTPPAKSARIDTDSFAKAWRQLNTGPELVDLVALGSPHFSLTETRRFARLLEGRRCHAKTRTLITLSRDTAAKARAEGLAEQLEAAGVTLLQDLCWCSISEPVFPTEAKHLLTNSGKYAHYAPGLCGRSVRFDSLRNCARAAVEGRLDVGLPKWLRQEPR